MVSSSIYDNYALDALLKNKSAGDIFPCLRGAPEIFSKANSLKLPSPYKMMEAFAFYQIT
jgi:hypothetical protein